MMYVPDSQLVQDEDDLESAGRQGAGLEEDGNTGGIQTPHVSISTTKVKLVSIKNSFTFSYL